MPMLRRVTRPASPVPVAGTGDLVVVHAVDPFTLAPGHQLRGAACMFCHQMAGAGVVTLVGVAGLAGDACSCGAVTSDVFLIHAAHLDSGPAAVTAAIRTAISCTRYHPVHS